MAHIKVNRQSPSLDMTPMVDLAFLLVTFFMLTTQFSAEQVVVDTPSSSTSITLEDKDLITISISKEGVVFFDVSGKYTREKLIQKIGQAYHLPFTPKEIHSFSILSSFGVPIGQLGSFLDMSAEERKAFNQTGIPCDSLNNELSHWIDFSASVNPKLRIIVKGDQDVSYPVVEKVISTLVDKGITNLSLITDMEERH